MVIVYVKGTIVFNEGSHEVSISETGAREVGDQDLDNGVSLFGIFITLKLSEFNFYFLENSFRALLIRLVFISDPFFTECVIRNR